ncbi:MAG TPA: Ig-like domain-containing protein [Gemmatimonadaceae bacterium]
MRAGDGQSARVGTALAIAPSVIVTDTKGRPFAGIRVLFGPLHGVGSVANTNALTDSTGLASSGTWTLGSPAGNDTVTGYIAGFESITGSPVTFVAVGLSGPATRVNGSSAASQIGMVGTPVDTAPRVHVVDAFGNGVAGVAVTFAVDSGGGSVAGAQQITDTNGVATVGSWTLGPHIGAQSLRATVAVDSLANNPVEFTATAVYAGSSLSIASGNNQLI